MLGIPSYSFFLESLYSVFTFWCICGKIATCCRI